MAIGNTQITGGHAGPPLRVDNFGYVLMRNLLRLLIVAWFIWLIYRAYKNQKQNQQEPSTGRKRVDSTVIEKETHEKDSGDKPQGQT